jgi:hypothetical protein
MNFDKIELGTPETAVKSCVNLLSRLFEQPEDYVACYLDLYYQVRRRWEESKTPSGAARQLPQGGSQETKKKRDPASYVNTAAHDAAVYKRGVRERFMQARQDGLSTPQVLAAAEGRVQEADVWKIIKGHQCGVDVYRELEKALDRLSL